MQEIIKKVSSTSFDVWIKTLDVVDLKGNTLVLATSSNSGKQTLLKNYKKFIVEGLTKVYPAIFDVEFVVSNQDTSQEEIQEPEKKAVEEKPQKLVSSSFNPKYTFDNFVVGLSNKFATAAAKSVAENPGESFNPLFIYGGVGLGKTHLLHAIGNYITENNPKLNVVYVTTDKFRNELIESIQNSKFGKKGATSSFREKYRNVDILMLDDIQYLKGQIQTQEELFHTFNELYENKKQMVFASDRPVAEIKPLEERITTRLAWGMIADIGYPELETRIAILRKKATLERYNVARDVIEYIAENVTTNVREMEGMLTRVVFEAKLRNESVVTMDIARDALKEMVNQNEQSMDASRIIDCVCKFYNLKKDELLGRKRLKEIAQARQVAIYLITELMSLPQEAVGRIFNKDHSTVIYAKNKVAEDIKKDKKLAVEINDMKQMLKGK